MTFSQFLQRALKLICSAFKTVLNAMHLGMFGDLQSEQSNCINKNESERRKVNRLNKLVKPVIIFLLSHNLQCNRCIGCSNFRTYLSK